MAKKRIRLDERNIKIRQEVDDLIKKKHLQMDYAFRKIAEKYYLESQTVYLIYKSIGAYSVQTQCIASPPAQ